MATLSSDYLHQVIKRFRPLGRVMVYIYMWS